MSQASATDLTHLDDNRVLHPDGSVICVHCGAELGHRDSDYLAKALRRERAPEASGPNIRVKAAVFVDQTMVLRQALCPNCYVVLQTEIVPEGEAFWRTSRLGRTAPNSLPPEEGRVSVSGDRPKSVP